MIAPALWAPSNGPMVSRELLGAGFVEAALADANAELLATVASAIERRCSSLSIFGKLSFATPFRALLAGAESMSLVVIGMHRRHMLAGMMLGLVGHDLVMHSPCPVVIVSLLDRGGAALPD